MRHSTREVTAAYIASGIDPERCIIFNQSMVSAHAELGWLLGCLTPLGWLNRMTQFKEKAGKHRDNAGLGLYAYPVLMAADILAYKATHVPVGEDQKQHLELARDIAGAFNRRYERDFFPLPEPQIFGEATRVMSLRDGTKKMSKSDTSDYSRLNMTDDADPIALKIRRAKTDPEPLPAHDADLEKRPEADNLVGIYAALADLTREAALARFAGQNFSTFKEALSALAVEVLGRIGGEMRRLMADPGHIDAILRRGAERAAAIAMPDAARGQGHHRPAAALTLGTHNRACCRFPRRAGCKRPAMADRLARRDASGANDSRDRTRLPRMDIYLPIAEVSLDVSALLGLGAAIGFLSGVFGVGGGFLLTPMLMFIGVPPAVAVASSANQLVGASVSGVLAHWRRGNVDFKMGFVLLLGGLAGSVLGVWLFTVLKRLGQIELVISLCYVLLLGTLGFLMMIESVRALLRQRRPGARRKLHQHNWMHGLPLKTRFRRSKLYISALLPTGLGFWGRHAQRHFRESAADFCWCRR